MANPLDQITFDFSGEEVPKEFLSGRALPPEVPKPKSTRGRKSMKDAAAEQDKVNVPEDDILFQKQYYSISDVAKMFGVNNSLIRYWENEFDVLEPKKNKKGDRFFKPSDIKNLQMIYDLIRRQKYTLEGARDYIKRNKKADEKHAMIQSLQRMRSFLLELKAHL